MLSVRTCRTRRHHTIDRTVTVTMADHQGELEMELATSCMRANSKAKMSAGEESCSAPWATWPALRWRGRGGNLEGHRAREATIRDDFDGECRPGWQGCWAAWSYIRRLLGELRRRRVRSEFEDEPSQFRSEAFSKKLSQFASRLQSCGRPIRVTAIAVPIGGKLEGWQLRFRRSEYESED